MWDSAPAFRFRAAIADIRGLIQPAALLFDESGADLVAFNTGSAMGVTDHDLPAYIGALAPETFRAEAVWVVKDPFRLYVIEPVQPDFL